MHACPPHLHSSPLAFIMHASARTHPDSALCVYVRSHTRTRLRHPRIPLALGTRFTRRYPRPSHPPSPSPSSPSHPRVFLVSCPPVLPPLITTCVKTHWGATTRVLRRAHALGHTPTPPHARECAYTCRQRVRVCMRARSHVHGLVLTTLVSPSYRVLAPYCLHPSSCVLRRAHALAHSPTPPHACQRMQTQTHSRDGRSGESDDDANYAGSPPPPPPRRRHSGTPVPLKQRRKRRRVITTTAADDADNARSPPLLCPHVNNDAAVSPPPTITATPPRRQRRRHHNHHAPMSVSTTATSPSPSPPALSHDDDAPSPSESESPSPLPSSRDEGTAVTAEDDAVIVGDISSQPPHCSTFDLHENSVATQIDLTAHLLAGLSLPSDAPLRTQELREALKESFTAVQSMINEYIQMAQWHHRHHVTTVPHVNDSDDAAVAPPPSPVCPHFQCTHTPVRPSPRSQLSRI
ncbi:hypothetical protein EV363DRAFT_1578488 [Boletus edulis]|nr:hypothetical protein EV363DRAFT_1578488 [Boletus edulis]